LCPRLTQGPVNPKRENPRSHKGVRHEPSADLKSRAGKVHVYWGGVGRAVSALDRARQTQNTGRRGDRGKEKEKKGCLTDESPERGHQDGWECCDD